MLKMTAYKILIYSLITLIFFYAGFRYLSMADIIMDEGREEEA